MLALTPLSYFFLTRRNRRSIAPPEQIIEKRPRHHGELAACRIDGVSVTQDGKALHVEHGELEGARTDGQKQHAEGRHRQRNHVQGRDVKVMPAQAREGQERDEAVNRRTGLPHARFARPATATQQAFRLPFRLWFC